MAESNCRLEIIVQPQDRFRFRTLKDPKHGAIKGIDDQEISVELKGFMGKQSNVIVLCTIYHLASKEELEKVYPESAHHFENLDESSRMYPHPNVLIEFGEVGEELKVKDKKGNIKIFKVNYDPIKSDLNNWKATFSNMVIIRTKKEDKSFASNKKLLKIRQYKPDYLINLENIIENFEFNMKNIKLCFEAFEKNGEQYSKICEPIFSNNIQYNDKGINEFALYCLSKDYFGKTAGNEELIILYVKNVRVRFFEQTTNWEAFSTIKPNKEASFCSHCFVITTPEYRQINIIEKKEVKFELIGEINNQTVISTSIDFTYEATTELKIASKKRKVDEINIQLDNCIRQHFSAAEKLKIGNDKELVKLLTLQQLRTDGKSNEKNSSTSTAPGQELSAEQQLKLLKALKENNNILHNLIRENENKNELNQFFKVIKDNKLEEILKLQNDDGDTCLHVASYYNRTDYIEDLTYVDPNIQNNKGDTPLHIAIEKNHYKFICKILVHSQNVNLEITNDKGYTPLYLAFLLENYKIAKHLITFNKELTTFQHPTNGNTILHLAVEKMNEEMVKFLLENTPVDKNLKNHCCIAPLGLAIKYDADNIIELLIA